jgi:hypothetical protein
MTICRSIAHSLLCCLCCMTVVPALADDTSSWETARKVACPDAKWIANDTSTRDIWDAVTDHVEQDLGIHHVCLARLIWRECQMHPRYTVEQAVDSIVHKIKDNIKIPEFRCGA